jgi:DNA adenine methylase
MQAFDTLYILMIYGFNRMIRLNAKGKFNLPVGNVDFNKNVESALYNYLYYVAGRNIEYKNKDWKTFLDSIKIQKNDFLYFDPPYLITFSEYNKLWNDSHEKALLAYLDKLNAAGVRFAISNVMEYRGRKNSLFAEWAKKYNVYEIKSNYISYHNNSAKDIKEVLVSNYD